MKLLLRQTGVLTFGIFMTLAAASESIASIACTSSTTSAQVVVGEGVATVFEDANEVARFAVPIAPAMSTSNGSYAATFSTHNFVLTILVDELQPETLDGSGFVAYQAANGPTSFEVECETELAELPEAPLEFTPVGVLSGEPPTPIL